ncbi:alpha/beta-Hydrolase [Glarea lozoyensis ATCC 20868]|uniref:Alpha/beta-Hydrolase n=1 Tax=Glarea lozoyensis (strain ATCC 20868 / MF5171) TaxID=1116229 RepID=S3CRH7_GLAL2|nr:alpha/beta-Hydrolase [Glarea lozoyensis ATCC 20868]EPE29082.1 alpha/beta-Hydrolase [Glarea lozoyensis ATCC 20868]
MRNLSILFNFLLPSALGISVSIPSIPQTLLQNLEDGNGNVSTALFADLEEFSRIVDISYCVGTTGIQYPFLCASRCEEFPGFELVETYCSGVLAGEGCGYIVLDHGTGEGMRKGKGKKVLEKGEEGEMEEREGYKRVKGNGKDGRKGRIIVAFRGTYSIANTIIDLSTVPQEYIPYPEDPSNSTSHPNKPWWKPWRQTRDLPKERKCKNCTVHTGFFTTWQNLRPLILPHLNTLHERYPDYELHLVGHSLGGAVAALAGLELEGKGMRPTVTTFGEPRIGNEGLRNYLDDTFALKEGNGEAQGSLRGKGEMDGGRYRRVTHVDDPVPLLPLEEWGYKQHAGEIYIGKKELQPAVADLRMCSGDNDRECLDAEAVPASLLDLTPEEIRQFLLSSPETEEGRGEGEGKGDMRELRKRWGLPIGSRFKMWQLFFAHRDYFWRLGLCVPGGDPGDWGRGRYGDGDEPQ